jgi:hypothetical protein
MTCPNCGETIIGDGYRWPLHCPNAMFEVMLSSEPDCAPIFCPLIHVSIWKMREPEDEVSSGSHH